MKRSKDVRSMWVAVTFFFGVAAWPAGAVAAPAEEPAPDVSSYGTLQRTDVDGDAAPMPLKHTRVDAKVSGFLAAVKVEQRFHNPFDQPIEAVYTFPLPRRAAVYAMQMTIGQRHIVGSVKKRAEARKLYEEAKKRGQTAALLDQQRPNIFTQRVANILPGEEIVVTLKYAQDLEYERGRYEFVFPMVVGPRYVGGGTRDPAAISPPFLRKGRRPGHDISVTLQIDAGMPIRSLSVPTHKVSRTWDPGNRVTLELADGDTLPNRDFVVRYSIDGDRPSAAILAHKDQRGGHFLMMVQPEAEADESAVAPREYVFVVDTSGSMRGVPIDHVRKVVGRCLAGMTASDSFQLIAFAGSARRFFPTAVPANDQNVKAAMEMIRQMRGSGGTEFLPALDLALNAPEDPQRSRVVLFLTDGYIGYEDRVLAYLRDHVGEANVFAMGIGSSVNRFLIDGIGRIGMGRPFYLLNHESADPIVNRFYDYVSRPTLTSIDVDFGDLDVEELTPGRLPDLFSERPLFLMGRYDKGGRGVVKLKGLLAGRTWTQELDVYLPESVTDDGTPVMLPVAVPLPEGVEESAVGGGGFWGMGKGVGASHGVGAFGGMGGFGFGRGGGGMRLRGLARGAGFRSRERPPPAGLQLGLLVPAAKLTMAFSGALGIVEEDSAGAADSSILRRRAKSLRVCLAQSPGTSVRLEVRLKIGDDGTVLSVKFVQGAEAIPTLSECFRAQIKKWRFPAGAGKRTVTFPLRLGEG